MQAVIPQSKAAALIYTSSVLSGYRLSGGIGFQTTMIRAVEWLATRKTTYPAPKGFPKETISVRDEADYPRGVQNQCNRFTPFRSMEDQNA